MPAGTGNTALMLAMAYYSFMLFLTLLFMRRDSIHLKFWIPDVKTGVIKGILAFPILLLITTLISLIFPLDLNSLPKGNEKISLPLFFVVAVLLAPLVEELMFRGYMQEYFRKRFKTEWTIVISALIFTMYHPFPMFPQIFVMGIFLSTLREVTSSLVPGMVVHAVNNILTFFMVFMASSGS